MRDSAGGLRNISGWMSQFLKHEKRCISRWILALSILAFLIDLGSNPVGTPMTNDLPFSVKIMLS
jgi:hypothetical protein